MAVVDELDQAAAAAAKAAKSAHRAMVLTMFAVAVAIAVLAIDNGIKRSIIEEAQQVREAMRVFREATDALGAAVKGTADGGADNSVARDHAGGMDEPPGTRTAANSHEGAGKAPRAGAKGGPRARP